MPQAYELLLAWAFSHVPVWATHSITTFNVSSSFGVRESGQSDRPRESVSSRKAKPRGLNSETSVWLLVLWTVISRELRLVLSHNELEPPSQVVSQPQLIQAQKSFTARTLMLISLSPTTSLMPLLWLERLFMMRQLRQFEPDHSWTKSKYDPQCLRQC
jgi:hypothetical protein